MNRELHKEEWVRQFRAGLCKSAARYRRMLIQPGELSIMDRQGIVNLLTTFEEFLMDVEFEEEGHANDE